MSGLVLLLVAGFVGGCSRGDAPDERTAASPFGSAVADARASADDTAGASERVFGEVEVGRDERRCVRLRLVEAPRLVAQILDEGPLPDTVDRMVRDCGRAVVLADSFVDSALGGDPSTEVRLCLWDVFVGLSASERVSVTATVTGTGDGDDEEAAAEMAAGVNACKAGEGRD